MSDGGLAEGLFCAGHTRLSSGLGCAQHGVAAALSLCGREREWAGRCKEAEFFHCLQQQSPCLLCLGGGGHGSHFIGNRAGLFSAAKTLHNDLWIGAED